MQPLVVVELKEGLAAVSLEGVDEFLGDGDCAGDELLHAAGLQGGAVAHVVVSDEVVDTHGRVAVGHVETTAWGTRNHRTCRQRYLLNMM